ncbi:MAG: YlmC/YmxH family sporulation protein [Clostridia bacterium]|nr:YlmC/YmxH family sporulation protein [Clostridia bacterium]
MSFNELKKKEVLDISTGSNLGKPTDLVFAKKSGKIEKIISSGRKSGFLSCESVEIPFHSVIKIGDDAILVEFLKRPREEIKPPPCCELTCEEKEDGFCDD